MVRKLTKFTGEEHREFDELLAGEIYTSPEIRTNLEYLCDDLGSRFAGTVEEARAADFLESKLQEYGLADVHREECAYPGWRRGAARFTVTAPWQRELKCLSMPMSPARCIRGKIVDVGTGAPDRFEALQPELNGNIALVSIANPPGINRWVHRTEKYNRTILSGARAFIFMGDEQGYGPITGTLAFNRWGMIPGVMISRETGLLLRRAIKRPGLLEGEIETTDTLAQMTSWNIVGDVNGRSTSDEMVVIGCHYDGHDISQGAVDPVSGLVGTLDIARALSLHADRLKRRIRFVCFGVEELGLIGAHAYVKRHTEDLDKTRFMFNLDGAGNLGRKGVIVYGADSRDYFRSMGERMNESLIADFDIFPLREPEHLSADHYPFVAAGLSCACIGDPYIRSASGFYHTEHDTVDKVSALSVREAAILAARLAWRIANDDDWPFRRLSEKERLRQKAEYDQLDVRLVEKALDALRAKAT